MKSKMPKPLFSIGLFADAQYADKKSHHKRYYNKSLDKLKECVSHFNNYDLQFVVNLGDLIDENESNFQQPLEILKNLKPPLYHVLGNHDYSVSDEFKSKIPGILGMKQKYYTIKRFNWRFIFLDGNVISLFATPENSPEYNKSLDYRKKNKISSPRWNGGINMEQITWLKNELDQAENSSENVVIFCHYPIYPKDVHNLINTSDILSTLSLYSNIKAYIAGHFHKGNFGVLKQNDDEIPFFTLKGMVDTKKNAYTIVHLYQNSLKIEGFARENFKNLPKNNKWITK
jgi:manganese-dependent ADP-ribose/CDP-alcohol diphosphatase